MTDETFRATMLTKRYEELRAFASGEATGVTPPKGLVLFLRQGMPGWIGAWSHLVSAGPIRPPCPAEGIPGEAAGSLQAEVVLVLAGMALSASRR
ncbi:hypothetical protein M1N87_01125 [Dehalococcoidia bacterium]|nr:hypothetical protein [Dehalococcoidia bacterium]MCL0102649.1 hypothetical protein [Dehalococcoidia bacterium]